MKKILLTGGAGYIGSKIAHDLVDLNCKVIIIDNLSNGNKNLIPKKTIFKKIDISNLPKLEDCFKKNKFDAIYHFAAKKKVDESQIKPLKYFKTNVIGTKNILDLLVKYKVKNLIFSSTCAVYGNVKNPQVSESHPTLPESYYGYTKLISEETIKNYQKKFKFNYAILRYFNVIGADSKLRMGEKNKGSLFKNLILAIKKKQNFSLFGINYKTKDGSCIRDYIDVNDLSKLHILSHEFISKKKKSILFNCGYNKPLSVLDIIKKFENILKKKIIVKIKKKRLGDIEKIFCNNSMQKKLFPKWKQKTTIEMSILNTLQWEKLIPIIKKKNNFR